VKSFDLFVAHIGEGQGQILTVAISNIAPLNAPDIDGGVDLNAVIWKFVVTVPTP